MTSFQPFNTYGLKFDSAQKNRPTQTRLRIRIPKDNYQEPVISNLIVQHELKVTILAAFLGFNALDDGWFDLKIDGKSEQIESALIYLSDLNVEVWKEAAIEQDGW
jgi:ABC-type methionine transport system ATPase subunit